MADFQLANNYQFTEAIGYTLASTTGTSLTSTGAGLSSFVELVASTAEDSDLMVLYFLPGVDLDRITARLNVAVGGAGNEELIAEGIFIDGKPNSTRFDALRWRLPIPIPAGTRISFQADFVATGRVITLAANLFSGTFQSQQSFSSLKSYGFNGVDGIQVDPGATINTKGSWTEIVASMPDSVEAFYVGLGSATNNAQSNADYLFDVSLGSSGNEDDAVIAENTPIDSTTAEVIRPHPFVDTKIPVGSRVSIRAQCTINDVTDRLLSATIEGFR